MIVVNKHDAEFGLTIGAIPVTIIILLMAAYWTRRESKLGMVLIIVSLGFTISLRGHFASKHN